MPGIGPKRLAALLTAFETANGALSAPFAFLCRVPGISPAGATAIRAARIEDGARILARVESFGGRCLLRGEPEFPARLAEIPDAPVMLFVSGRLDLLEREAVAIVGSRDHSQYGADMCRMISERAARAGLAVVSGMARGLDAVAHHAALDVGGATIGVLGNGFGVIYPAANKGLYERVFADGLMVTEFPPGERPHHGSFPRRNRLISAMARVTVVVEAVKGSGTMLTVESALSQGRDVMAVPGPITSSTSEGTNRLIRDGAEPLLETIDLLRHYGVCESSAPGESPRSLNPSSPVALPEGLSEGERAVLSQLRHETRLADDLALALEVPVAGVLDLLSGLELAGVVEGLPGGRYRRTSR